MKVSNISFNIQKTLQTKNNLRFNGIKYKKETGDDVDTYEFDSPESKYIRIKNRFSSQGTIINRNEIKKIYETTGYDDLNRDYYAPMVIVVRNDKSIQIFNGISLYNVEEF